MHVAAGWACTDLATTNSLPPLPAQLLVGKPIRFNTAEKKKSSFFLKAVSSSAQNGQVPKYSAGNAGQGMMGEREAAAEGGWSS